MLTNKMLTDNIMPKPKKCVLREGSLFLGETGNVNFDIAIDADAPLLVKEGAEILAGKVEQMVGVRPAITPPCSIMQGGKMLVALDTALEGDACTCCNDFTDEAYKIVIKSAEDYQTGAVSAKGDYAEKAGECDAAGLECDAAGLPACAVRISGSSGKGVFYGVQTFIQMLEMKEGCIRVPACTVEDWPDTEFRGLFMEDKWGTDRMTLADWKDMIDYMASLKYNMLKIGLYGCWVVQYSGEVTEFCFHPSKKYPELKTEKTIRYYSPSKGEWVVADYLPEIYRSDFLGEIIEYGKSRNVKVFPLFNSLGHTTLIPRLFPQSSSKNARGEAKKYGYCISNPATYEILYNIYDEIIDGYLAPNGIDWFAVGLDEVVNSVGIYPDAPQNDVNPWCECGECSRHSKEEMFVEHIVKLCKHLKEKGIRHIVIWNDQLLAMKLINEDLVERFKQEGLFENIILEWWTYGLKVFETTNPELGFRRFLMPMTGYYAWMLTDSYLTNITEMVKLGKREGMEGILSYCVFDFSYDRNYCCLANFSWNHEGVEDVGEFRKQYIGKHFGDGNSLAGEAFSYFDRLTEQTSEEHNIVFRLLNYYWYTYVRTGKDYPRNFPGEIYNTLLSDTGKYRELLVSARCTADKTCKLFSELLESMEYNTKLLKHYIVECSHYRILADEFLTMLEIGEEYNRICSNSRGSDNGTVIKSMISRIDNLIRERERVMLDIEQTKSVYWIPSLFRNMSIYREYLIDIGKFFNGAYDAFMEGKPLPGLDLTDTRNLEGKMFKLLR